MIDRYEQMFYNLNMESEGGSGMDTYETCPEVFPPADVPWIEYDGRAYGDYFERRK